MQVYTNSNRLSPKTILFFIIILLFAFLPISTFLFFLKDDAFTGYFPPKFFMSESLHAGYLPLWNPYINFGIPQYGDMSSGFWSPITWLIASTIGYNAYTLTAEVLLYILLGGIGMYKLSQAWQLEKHTCIIAAVAYMCCGFNIGHLQHFNWLSGAAFLPWCLWSYLLLIHHFSIKNAVRAALVFYMLIASAHPGIIISAVYFFIAVFLFDLFHHYKQQTIKQKIKETLGAHGLLFFILALLCAGMIAGYMDIIPHFVRGAKVSLSDALLNPTTPQSWISPLLPFSTTKNAAFFNTDISMRNCYFSLVLLLFFIAAVVQPKNKWQKFLLVAGALFMLLSFGGVFKTFAYKFIPFIGYVRLNGEFRIFTILCFILVAAIQLDKFIKAKSKFEGSIKWIYYGIEILLFICIIFGITKSVTTHGSFLYSTKTVFAQHGIATKLKALIDSISFYDTLWIQGFIQLFLLWGIKWCLKFRHWNILKDILIADMILACLLNIPFTGVGQTSVAHIQDILNDAPKGIPIPSLQPIINNDTISLDEKMMIGDWSFYNKQIGVKEQVAYPIILKDEQNYFDSISLMPQYNFTNQAFLFTQYQSSDTTKSNCSILHFSPNTVQAHISSDSNQQLILQENFYPHWYYQNNSEKKEVLKAGINFMSARIVKGDNTVVFSFEPILVEKAMMVSLVSFIICCLLLIALRTKPFSLS
jgi:hypothetical protein